MRLNLTQSWQARASLDPGKFELVDPGELETLPRTARASRALSWQGQPLLVAGCQPLPRPGDQRRRKYKEKEKIIILKIISQKFDMFFQIVHVSFGRTL